MAKRKNLISSTAPEDVISDKKGRGESSSWPQKSCMVEWLEIPSNFDLMLSRK
jgi:hypothetical protein